MVFYKAGVRKPPVPFGLNGRSVSGSVVPSSTAGDRKSLRLQVGPEPTDMKTATVSVSTPEQRTFERGDQFALSKRKRINAHKFYKMLNILSRHQQP